MSHHQASPVSFLFPPIDLKDALPPERLSLLSIKKPHRLFEIGEDECLDFSGFFFGFN